MGFEDFPFFTVDPDIMSVYWSIGGSSEPGCDVGESRGWTRLLLIDIEFRSETS